MKIMQLKNVEDVCDALQRYNDSATRKLTDRVGSLKTFAEKLFEYAENYIIYQKDIEIGFFSFYANDMINKKAYLTIIAVDEQHQKEGNGSQALQFIMNECRAKQMARLRLEVDKTNDSAICFYKANGFLIVEEASEISVFMEREV